MQIADHYQRAINLFQTLRQEKQHFYDMSDDDTLEETSLQSKLARLFYQEDEAMAKNDEDTEE